MLTITVVQYAYNIYVYKRFQRLAREVVRKQQLRKAKSEAKQLASKKERQRARAEAEERIEADIDATDEITVFGAQFPSLEDLFIVTLFLAPLLLVRLARDHYRYNIVGEPRPLVQRFFNDEHLQDFMRKFDEMPDKAKRQCATMLKDENYDMPPAIAAYLEPQSQALSLLPN